MENRQIDVAVIGAGPAGYVAAIKLAQLGKSVICIDDKEMPGGTCMNVGCIPSKTLLQASHKYFEAKNEFSKYGIETGALKVNLSQMMDLKQKVINELGSGIKGLFKKNGVQYLQGKAKFIDHHNIEVTQLNDPNNKVTVNAQHSIIATGSQVSSLPGIIIDEKFILSSTGALSLSSIPDSMVIIGAGVIGLEMGSVWSRLGSKVTIIEYSDKVLAGADDDVSKEVQKILTKQGIEFILGAQVMNATIVNDASNGKSEVEIKYNLLNEKKNVEQNNKISCDVVLVAVGRKANTEHLDLDKIGVSLNSKGQVIINGNFNTNVSNIYAIGDVVEGPMLAHKASEEGVAVAEIIADRCPYINYDIIPNVIYTHPEIAIIGKSEAILKQSNIEYKVGKFPFLANSRAKVNRSTEGFVKIISCAKTDTILGATIISPAAGEMIHEIGLAMEFKATSEDLSCISHAHPTLSEAIKEASYSVFSKAIHI